MTRRAATAAEPAAGVDLRDRLVDVAFGAGWAAGRRVPDPVLAAGFAAAADVVWARRRRGVQQLEANLTRACPHLSAQQRHRLARLSLRSYFRYWHEVFALPTWSRDRVLSAVEAVGLAELQEAFGAGKGVILALPHMANWDLAGAFVALSGMPVSSVAERLRPHSLFDRFVAYRRSIGVDVVSLAPGARPVREMLDALAHGRLVCLVADRDLTGAGVEVSFLDEPARFPSGPATLARRSGAPLFAVTLSYVGSRMQAELGDRVETDIGVPAMTQRLADLFGAAIRRSPADWHMMQPVFAADLGGSA